MGKKREPPGEPVTYKPSEPQTHQLAEARAVYLVPPTDAAAEPAERGTTRLSSKNQITLPVEIVRQLGLRAGDEIDLLVVGGTIQLERLPRTPREWVEKYRGSIDLPGWETREKIDEYVRGERESWTRDTGDS
ncbi:MAG: AbrB/MazE/SpoVT family DNA-binding domain-containing protein [Chloroflexota bacterium]|nr:AbrB/MazE/SpoVT family DNA-binding domain-containing protein [Chloroflexota bacterium]